MTAQLKIFDEGMTGFGRTGDWFASTKAQANSDIICLSKGITGGFLPLAVTVCTEAIYDAFYSDNLQKTLYHGHSYAANPLGGGACVYLSGHYNNFECPLAANGYVR